MKDNNFKKINSTKDLVNLQRAFAEIIRKPLKKNDQMPEDPRSKKIIQGNKKLTPHQRLQLYSQQYWWRIQNSFDEDFISLSNIIGHKKYILLRDLYLNQYPSISFTLRNLGIRFPKFIKDNPKLTKPYTKSTLDYAKYEIAKINAFDALEYPKITLEEITSKNFIKFKLQLQPHIQLLKLNFKIRKEIIQQQKETSSNTGKKQNLYKKISDTKRENLGTYYYIVYRLNHKLHYKECSKMEFKILSKFSKSCSLSELLSDSVINKKLTQELAFEYFRTWISLGWLYKRKTKNVK